MGKYHIITYGCQTNHSDSERIAAVLEGVGLESVPKYEQADLIVVNACSVRQSAIDRIHGKINDFAKLKIKNEKSKTVLTGCVLPADRKIFLKKFDLILDINDLAKLPKFLGRSQRSITKHDRYLKILPSYQNKFSACVPIMTGCDNWCTYCAVPFTRGREVSRPAKEIICEVGNLAKRGYKEIWLLGQNVNSYNMKHVTYNKNKMTFPELLRKINDISGNFWIRFTSPHPKDFSDDLIRTMAECEKVTEYVNLPVQAGDDTVLKRMARPYTVKDYKSIVKKLRKAVPGIAISTDTIVGFPGETRKQFQNTLKLFREMKFDMAYISQFSPRAGTAAARMEDDVPKEEKKGREKELTEILKKTALESNKKYIGRAVEVLIDEEKGEFLYGKTRTYKSVRVPKCPAPKGRGSLNKVERQKSKVKSLVGAFVEVKIDGAGAWGLSGRLRRPKRKIKNGK